jgi:hypothetical protein
MGQGRRTAFKDCTYGGIKLQAALCLPMIVMLCGGAIDLVEVTSQRQHLQAAVDAAALAGARELGLSDARRENVAAAVEAMVRVAIAPNLSAAAPPRRQDSRAQQATRGRNRRSSGDEAGLWQRGRHRAADHRGGSDRADRRPSEHMRSGARPIGEWHDLAREERACHWAELRAILEFESQHHSIASKNSAVLSAALICSAGGRDGMKANFNPEPLTDCPTFDDPLAARPEPRPAPCNPALPKSVTKSGRLSPGTYCGGLTIGAGGDVELEPGVYIIKDGPLTVSGGARLVGKGVGIFLTGSKATLQLEPASSIDLSAPEVGEMAGLLVFESRSQPESGVHQILSDDARNLLGTIYLPRGRLNVDANSPIADKSAYTAIVARKISLYGGPHLVLNSNYDETDVPVPEGIRGAAQPVSLVK